MFTTNGRESRKRVEKSTKRNDSVNNFFCKSCGEKKHITNIEFGEVVLCSCGKPMERINE